MPFYSATVSYTVYKEHKDKLCFVSASYSAILSYKQGWEFAHLFSERIARFLPKNEQMSDLLKKRAIHPFAHFWWATWAIRSRSHISSERCEQIAHGRSFMVSNLSDSLTSLIFGDSLTSLAKKEGMSDSLIF